MQTKKLFIIDSREERPDRRVFRLIIAIDLCFLILPDM
jgi:hypothetical protein